MTSSLDHTVNILNIDTFENNKIHLKSRINTIMNFKGCILIAGDKELYVYRNLNKIKVKLFK